MILTRPRLAVLGTVCLVALTGCGGGGGSNTAAASGSEAGGLRVPAAAGPAADRADAQSFSRAQVAKPGVDVQEQAIIRNGDLSIRTSDPQQARDGVDRLLVRLHGSLDDEQTVYDKAGRIRDSQLVLRVPGRLVRDRDGRPREARDGGALQQQRQGRHHRGDRRPAAPADPADQPARPQLVPAPGRRPSTSCCGSRTPSPSAAASTSRSRRSATTWSTRPACPRSTSTSPSRPPTPRGRPARSHRRGS